MPCRLQKRSSDVEPQVQRTDDGGWVACCCPPSKGASWPPPTESCERAPQALIRGGSGTGESRHWRARETVMSSTHQGVSVPADTQTQHNSRHTRTGWSRTRTRWRRTPAHGGPASPPPTSCSASRVIGPTTMWPCGSPRTAGSVWTRSDCSSKTHRRCLRPRSPPSTTSSSPPVGSAKTCTTPTNRPGSVGRSTAERPRQLKYRMTSVL